jgi:hypothetical protein
VPTPFVKSTAAAMAANREIRDWNVRDKRQFRRTCDQGTGVLACGLIPEGTTTKEDWMTNDQNRNQGQQGSGQQDQSKTGQQSGQQQRQGGQQGGKDQDNQYSRPGQGGQQGGQQDKNQK